MIRLQTYRLQPPANPETSPQFALTTPTADRVLRDDYRFRIPGSGYDITIMTSGEVPTLVVNFDLDRVDFERQRNAPVINFINEDINASNLYNAPDLNGEGFDLRQSPRTEVKFNWEDGTQGKLVLLVE